MVKVNVHPQHELVMYDRFCSFMTAFQIGSTPLSTYCLFSSTTLSRPQANFLHQTCIAGLVKHLSPYTERISE